MIHLGMRGPNRYVILDAIRNSRGEILSFRATLDAARNERGLVICPYIDCTVQPVHTSSCGVNRKRHHYTCNCGAREMFDKLVREAGESNESGEAGERNEGNATVNRN